MIKSNRLPILSSLCLGCWHRGRGTSSTLFFFFLIILQDFEKLYTVRYRNHKQLHEFCICKLVINQIELQNTSRTLEAFFMLFPSQYFPKVTTVLISITIDQQLIPECRINGIKSFFFLVFFVQHQVCEIHFFRVSSSSFFFIIVQHSIL